MNLKLYNVFIWIFFYLGLVSSQIEDNEYIKQLIFNKRNLNKTSHNAKDFKSQVTSFAEEYANFLSPTNQIKSSVNLKYRKNIRRKKFLMNSDEHWQEIENYLEAYTRDLHKKIGSSTQLLWNFSKFLSTSKNETEYDERIGVVVCIYEPKSYIEGLSGNEAKIIYHIAILLCRKIQLTKPSESLYFDIVFVIELLLLLTGIMIIIVVYFTRAYSRIKANEH